MQIQKDTEKRKNINRGIIKCIILLFGIFGFSILNFLAHADDSKVGPHPGLKPLDEDGAMQISNQDRCPICAMQVSITANLLGRLYLPINRIG